MQRQNVVAQFFLFFFLIVFLICFSLSWFGLNLHLTLLFLEKILLRIPLGIYLHSSSTCDLQKVFHSRLQSFYTIHIFEQMNFRLFQLQRLIYQNYVVDILFDIKLSYQIFLFSSTITLLFKKFLFNELIKETCDF